MFQLHDVQLGPLGRFFNGLEHGPLAGLARALRHGLIHLHWRSRMTTPLRLIGAAALLALSTLSFGQAAPGSATSGTSASPGVIGAPPPTAPSSGTTPNTTGIGAPAGSSSTSGTPLPGSGVVNTPQRDTFGNILNSGSSTGSSAS